MNQADPEQKSSSTTRLLILYSQDASACDVAQWRSLSTRSIRSFCWTAIPRRPPPYVPPGGLGDHNGVGYSCGPFCRYKINTFSAPFFSIFINTLMLGSQTSPERQGVPHVTDRNQKHRSSIGSKREQET